MEFVEIVTGVSSFIAGGLSKYLWETWRDRSKPDCSIVRLLLSSVVSIDDDRRARVPSDIANRYNVHPYLQKVIDFKKDMKLKEYLELLQELSESARVTLHTFTGLKQCLNELFQCLDRKDVLGFAERFLLYNEYIWAVIRGRCMRQITPPPTIPEELVTLESINPVPELRVYQGDENVYYISTPGAAWHLYFNWLKDEYPAYNKDIKFMAAELTKRVAEFDEEYLRTILGLVDKDIDNYTADLNKIISDIDFEQAKYRFLSVSILLRNKGRRPYCINPKVKLFIPTKGYTFSVNESSQPVTILDNTEIDLYASKKCTTHGVIEIPASSSLVVEFKTKQLFSECANYEAIRALSTAGERSCYIGIIPYTGSQKIKPFYTKKAIFTVRDTSSNIPSKEKN